MYVNNINNSHEGIPFLVLFINNSVQNQPIFNCSHSFNSMYEVHLLSMITLFNAVKTEQKGS